MHGSNGPEVKDSAQVTRLTINHSARAIYHAAANTDRHDLRIEDMYYVGIMRRKAKLNDPLSISELEWSKGWVGD